jgi:hypothetical protein
MIVWARQLSTSRSSDLKRVENLRKTIRVQAELQRPAMNKAWKNSRWSPFNLPRDCRGGEHLLWFVRSNFNWKSCHEAHRREVCATIVERWSQVSELPSLWGTQTKGRNGATFHESLHRRWWNRGLQVRPGNRALVFTMAVTFFTSPQESKTSPITCEKSRFIWTFSV